MRQLDAIWTGKIVFHSALDQAHRIRQDRRWPTAGGTTQLMSFRRAATVYDARDASLFKLSRLRVPRYKHATSTFSLAILLLLYVMVLIDRSYEITVLEAVFWVWSLGFMMVISITTGAYPGKLECADTAYRTKLLALPKLVYPYISCHYGIRLIWEYTSCLQR